MKKRLGAVALAAAVTMTLAACGGDGGSGGGGDQEEVTLAFITAFPENVETNDGFWIFQERLAENAPWITIEYHGGPEVMAANLMIEGVQSGAYDGVHIPGGYYVDQMPAMEVQRFTPWTPTQEREEGIFDLYAEMHEEQGLYLAGRTHAGVPQVLLFKNELTSPNLRGLSLRTSADASGVVQQLGGTPIDMPSTEVFTALERGVIDGTAYTSNGVTTQGWEGQLGYYMEPRFYDSTANLVINLDVWESLDEDTQQAINETIEEVEPEIVEHYQTLAAEETQAWLDAGMKQILFEGDDAKRVMEAAYVDAFEALDWDRILARAPQAEEIRDRYQAAYADDFSNAVPGGAVIEPKS